MTNCNRAWNITSRPLWATIEWGAYNIHACSNIVFSNGDYDPWSGSGVTTSLSESLVALVIKESAHHLDLFWSHPNDPELISADVKARKRKGEDVPTGFRKIPIVDLPLGATEDRVCGTIDIERALREGVKTFEPGIIAHANRGIIYVDEVNLLDDHLVDILLDSCVSGWNIVEREGISIRHPSRFIIVGSGNPEEGELRPQLLDRFGIYAKITTTRDADIRVQIVIHRSMFDSSPDEFCRNYYDSQKNLRDRISHAHTQLHRVEFDYKFESILQNFVRNWR